MCQINLIELQFGELAKCSQNMSCGQCDVSKHLEYRHILKSINCEGIEGEKPNIALLLELE